MVDPKKRMVDRNADWGTAGPVDPNTNDDTTPPYEDDDTSIFRVRFIATLSKLKEYMQNEEKKARWSTCFGMSDKGRFIISIV